MADDSNQGEDKPEQPFGRPTKFNEWIQSEISRLAPLGLTSQQLAAVLHVTEQTIINWQRKHKDFFESLRRNKRTANKQVAGSLFAAAMGFSHPEDKIFIGKDGEPIIVPTIKHYPPDIKAAALYLKNRDPDNWREKQEIEHSGGLKIEVVKYEDDQTTS